MSRLWLWLRREPINPVEVGPERLCELLDRHATHLSETQGCVTDQRGLVPASPERLRGHVRRIRLDEDLLQRGQTRCLAQLLIALEGDIPGEAQHISPVECLPSHLQG